MRDAAEKTAGETHHRHPWALDAQTARAGREGADALRADVRSGVQGTEEGVGVHCACPPTAGILGYSVDGLRNAKGTHASLESRPGRGR